MCFRSSATARYIYCWSLATMEQLQSSEADVLETPPSFFPTSDSHHAAGLRISMCITWTVFLEEVSANVESNCSWVLQAAQQDAWDCTWVSKSLPGLCNDQHGSNHCTAQHSWSIGPVHIPMKWTFRAQRVWGVPVPLSSMSLTKTQDHKRRNGSVNQPSVPPVRLSSRHADVFLPTPMSERGKKNEMPGVARELTSFQAHRPGGRVCLLRHPNHSTALLVWTSPLHLWWWELLKNPRSPKVYSR